MYFILLLVGIEPDFSDNEDMMHNDFDQNMDMDNSQGLMNGPSSSMDTLMFEKKKDVLQFSKRAKQVNVIGKFHFISFFIC